MCTILWRVAVHGAYPHAPVQRLNLDALLGSPEVLQRDTDAGRPAIDVGALGAALQQRYREQEQDSRRCAFSPSRVTGTGCQRCCPQHSAKGGCHDWCAVWADLHGLYGGPGSSACRAWKRLGLF